MALVCGALLFIDMSTKKRQQWEERDMQQALSNVQNNNMGFKLTAKTFSVPKTTLRRRFASSVESEIADHIIDMETRFFGLTRRLTTPESTSLARAQAFNKPNICAYFTATKTLDKHNFLPENIYNMDESGLTTVQKKSQKIYTAKGRKQIGALSSAERGQHVAVVCAMNAIAFPPTKDERQTHERCITREHTFRPRKRYTKASKDNKVLLLLDGHGSHKGLDALEFAKENGIIIFCFPTHCSHHVQPSAASYIL
ncbi:CENP-B N-terminal DNA-binding domain [Popillia japonica]|uniref:CENP-B N-terminal DNA-binding domain n=1 Tax=Popillia japonica TaxID=7064 RepID=A0AAW1JDA5_POPJA